MSCRVIKIKKINKIIILGSDFDLNLSNFEKYNITFIILSRPAGNIERKKKNYNIIPYRKEYIRL